MNRPWQVRVNEGIARVRARWMVDMEGLSSRLQNFIVSRLAIEPMVIEPDLAYARSWRALGMASVTTTGVWNVRFRKIILSHYALGPARHGLYLVFLPQRGMDHPCFYAELSAFPTELTATIDLYSPRFAEGHYAGQYSTPLGEARQAHQHLGGLEPSAAWMTGVGSGQGLTLRLPCENIEPVAAAVFDYLDRYLDMVLEAPLPGGLASDPEAETRSEQSVRTFTRALQPNIAARPAFVRLFGEDWTERYIAIVHGP